MSFTLRCPVATMCGDQTLTTTRHAGDSSYSPTVNNNAHTPLPGEVRDARQISGQLLWSGHSHRDQPTGVTRSELLD
ncbi:hypothetical protein RRG08_006747 [Elysia crispata]|uniref:Uncharacterized protein n=1 Tax=Elysia crispata TaxID=231223 RepID=A0AAE0Y637_9GAST|nr:hypothetical protein RRG08_006747 [Elysia crispata]